MADVFSVFFLIDAPFWNNTWMVFVGVTSSKVPLSLHVIAKGLCVRIVSKGFIGVGFSNHGGWFPQSNQGAKPVIYVQDCETCFYLPQKTNKEEEFTVLQTR